MEKRIQPADLKVITTVCFTLFLSFCYFMINAAFFPGNDFAVEIQDRPMYDYGAYKVRIADLGR